MGKKSIIRDLTVIYSLLQGAYCSAFAALSVYAVVILRGFGATYAEAGLMIAVLNILVMILMQRFSVLADLRGRESNRYIAAGAMALSAAFGILFILIRPKNGPACIVLYLFMYGAAGFISPFLDALSIRYIHGGVRIDYGAARGTGSICFALTSAALSLAYSTDGKDGILLVFLAAGLACLIILLFMPREPVREKAGDRDPEDEIAGEKGRIPVLGSRELFAVYRWLILFLAGLVLIRIAHQMAGGFLDAVAARAGVPVERMGMISGIGSAAELPFMFLAARVAKRLRPGRMILVSAVAAVLRMLFFVFARSPGWLIGAMLLQGPEFGLIVPAVVYFLAEAVDGQNQSKAQALNAAAFSFSTALSSILAGNIIDMAGAGAAMGAGLVFTAAGTVLLAVSLKGRGPGRPDGRQEA